MRSRVLGSISCSVVSEMVWLYCRNLFLNLEEEKELMIYVKIQKPRGDRQRLDTQKETEGFTRTGGTYQEQGVNDSLCCQL